MPAVRSNQSRRGQAAIFVTMALPLTLGILGLAVDEGWMFFRREAALAAAQAAALAGVTQVYKAGGSVVCNSGVSWCNTTPQQCAGSPNVPPHNSFDTACLYAKSNGYQVPSGGKINVTVEANTSTAPTAPNTSNSYYMTVRVTEKIPLTFLSVLGTGLFGSVSARASGGVNVTSGGGCIYIMNPTRHGAFPVTGGNVTTGCGIYVNSNVSDAMTMSGGNITLNNGADIYIHGGLSKTGGNISPAGNVKQNQPSVSNPFSGMTAPTPANSCTSDPTITGGNSNTINPGTYCGITVTGGNNVQFNSGVYILKTGSLTISGGTFSATTTNVLFYIPASNSGGKINITGGNMHWTGLSGGSQDGFVFWVDNSAAQTITGGNYTINGVTYMPSAALTYTGGNGTQQTLVVDSLTITGGNINTSASSGYFSGGGLTGGAFLVE